MDINKDMHWKTALGKPFLGAEDLPEGKDIKVKISKAGMEFITDPNFKVIPPTKEPGSKFVYRGTEYQLTDHGWQTLKLVVHFVGKDLAFIPNVTNCRAIQAIAKTGIFEKWAGVEIVIYRTLTTVKRVETPCIRVR